MGKIKDIRVTKDAIKIMRIHASMTRGQKNLPEFKKFRTYLAKAIRSKREYINHLKAPLIYKRNGD